MKTLLTAAALAIAFAAPAAEARTVKHQAGSHASSPVQAKSATKKAGKTKHKKSTKKASHKAA